MSGPNPKNRLHELNIMKNGMKARIIRYKSSADIDIQFEDGVVIKNKTYASFIKGMIGHPDTLHKSKIRDKTGEMNQMANGMQAKIVGYANSKNITVEFEDGQIRKGCAYKEFKAGNIAHPNHTSKNMAEERVGEKRLMKCGLTARITKYNSYHDIEITFEDGTIVYPVDYGRFIKESIAHPCFDGNTSLQESAIAFYFTRLGFVKMPRGSLKDCGLGRMELDLYHHQANIAIEIDGRFHKSESAIKRDTDKNIKCHNAGILLYRFREKGLPMLKDGYSRNYVIEGERLYNGLVDCGNLLQEIIRKCNLQCPSYDFVNFKRDLEPILKFHFYASSNYNSSSRKNEQVFHKSTNQFMKIIEYKDYQHVTVQFEDGEIVYDKNYGAFKKGEIKHPKQTPNAKKQARLNEERLMNCGYKAAIINYRSSEDIDIKFEDGTIRRGVTYFNFKKGTIKNKI